VARRELDVRVLGRTAWIGLGANHWWIARRQHLGHVAGQSFPVHAGCWLATYIFICVTWVLFRSHSFAAAGTMLFKMSGLAPGGIAWFYSPLFMVLPLVIAGHAIGVFAARSNRISGKYVLLPLPGFAGAFLATCWVLALLLFGATGANPFIYFQF
jgi:alginate O-acetyltransferase complex protein AlgI